MQDASVRVPGDQLQLGVGHAVAVVQIVILHPLIQDPIAFIGKAADAAVFAMHVADDVQNVPAENEPAVFGLLEDQREASPLLDRAVIPPAVPQDQRQRRVRAGGLHRKGRDPHVAGSASTVERACSVEEALLVGKALQMVSPAGQGDIIHVLIGLRQRGHGGHKFGGPGLPAQLLIQTDPHDAVFLRQQAHGPFGRFQPSGLRPIVFQIQNHVRILRGIADARNGPAESQPRAGHGVIQRGPQGKQ